MKINFLKIGFYATMFAMTIFLTACGGGEHNHDHEGHDHNHQHQHEQGHDHEGHQHQEEAEKEYTSTYICPMHCEGSGSDSEGKCPVCKMDYEKNEKL